MGNSNKDTETAFGIIAEDSGFSGSGVPEPLHPEFIDAHRRISNSIFVAGRADPAVVALTEDSHRTAMVHLSNRSIASDHGGPRVCTARSIFTAFSRSSSE